MRSLLVAGLRALAVVLFCATALAQDDYSVQLKALQEALPELKISSVTESPIPGLLEVYVGADIYYTSRDGRFFIQGEIFDIKSRDNVTELSRNQARVGYLDQIAGESAVIFAAEDPRYTVTVFTDIDCGFCRKLHQQVSAYNDLGISIRYLFFPRSGPATESWFKAESVWCAEDRNQALTQAKAGMPLPAAECGDTPVARHYELVNELGLRGTPAIFTEAGDLLVGYRSPDDLIAILTGEVDAS